MIHILSQPHALPANAMAQLNSLFATDESVLVLIGVRLIDWPHPFSLILYSGGVVVLSNDEDIIAGLQAFSAELRRIPIRLVSPFAPITRSILGEKRFGLFDRKFLTPDSMHALAAVFQEMMQISDGMAIDEAAADSGSRFVNRLAYSAMARQSGPSSYDRPQTETTRRGLFGGTKAFESEYFKAPLPELFCKSCLGTHLKLAYKESHYQAVCLFCGHATPIDIRCGAPGCSRHIIRKGTDFVASCRTCKATKIFSTTS